MGPESPRYPVVTSRVSMEHSLRGSQVSKARPHGTPGQAGAPFAFFRHGGFRMRVLVQERGGLDRIQIALKAGMLQRLVRVTRRVVTVHDCPMMTVIGSIAGVECVPFGGRRGVAQDNAHGAAPTALPRQAGAGGITMIDTQPFRAGLTFGDGPPGLGDAVDQNILCHASNSGLHHEQTFTLGQLNRQPSHRRRRQSEFHNLT
jgi:hypothetical protein